LIVRFAKPFVRQITDQLQPEPGILHELPADHVHGTVVRTIIHDDDVERAIDGLPGERLQATPEQVATIPIDHHDGNRATSLASHLTFVPTVVL
jgi:hypothetical protein